MLELELNATGLQLCDRSSLYITSKLDILQPPVCVWFLLCGQRESRRREKINERDRELAVN